MRYTVIALLVMAIAPCNGADAKSRAPIIIHENASYLASWSDTASTGHLCVLDCAKRTQRGIVLGSSPQGSLVIDGSSAYFLSKGRLESIDFRSGQVQTRICPELASLEDVYCDDSSMILLGWNVKNEMAIYSLQGSAIKSATKVSLDGLADYKGSTRLKHGVVFFFLNSDGLGSASLLYEEKKASISLLSSQAKVELQCGLLVQGHSILCGNDGEYQTPLDSFIIQYWANQDKALIETARRYYIFSRGSETEMELKPDEAQGDSAILTSCGVFFYTGSTQRWYSGDDSVEICPMQEEGKTGHN